MRDFLWMVWNWLERAWEWVRELIMKVVPHSGDAPEMRSLKLTVFLFIGIIGLMIIIGAVTFAIAVRGQEETLVPNVQGKDLVAALVELQEKELYADINAQFSSEADKDIILDQRPAPGTLVKAGKRVSLRVSKGPVINQVEDYVGQTLDQLKIHLQTLFSSHAANLVIHEPVMYKYDTSVPAGTILAQTPKPGTKISGITSLELVVSQNQGETTVEVGDYVGKSFHEALSDMTRLDVPFTFVVQKSGKGKGAGVVVSQNPQPKEKLRFGQAIQLTMTAPSNIGKDKVFGVFRYTLPDQPIAVDTRLDVVSAAGSAQVFAMKHPGGALAVPYIVSEGSELVLSVLDKEVAREKATPAD